MQAIDNRVKQARACYDPKNEKSVRHLWALITHKKQMTQIYETSQAHYDNMLASRETVASQALFLKIMQTDTQGSGVSQVHSDKMLDRIDECIENRAIASDSINEVTNSLAGLHERTMPTSQDGDSMTMAEIVAGIAEFDNIDSGHRKVPQTGNPLLPRAPSPGKTLDTRIGASPHPYSEFPIPTTTHHPMNSIMRPGMEQLTTVESKELGPSSLLLTTRDTSSDMIMGV